VHVATRAEADALAAQARAMPLDAFRHLAAERDALHRGGELPYCDAQGRPDGNATAPKLDGALVQQVFGLGQVGDVAAPFEHAGGFVVLRMTALKPGSGERYEEAARAAREGLLSERRVQAVEALLTRLRGEYPVVVHEALLGLPVLDAPPPADRPAGFPAAPVDPTAPTQMVEPDGA